MKYLLDAGMLLCFMRDKPRSLAARINALSDDDSVGMSYITLAALLRGAQLSARRTELLRRLDALARVVPVHYATGRALCEHHAEQSVRLAATGASFDESDLWLACHVLADAATLVTDRAQVFESIPGLRLENWAY